MHSIFRSVYRNRGVFPACFRNRGGIIKEKISLIISFLIVFVELILFPAT